MFYDPSGKLQQQTELEGIEIDKIEVGQKIVVQTKNSTYTLERIEGDRKVKVQGGKYFLNPTEAVMIGSTFGGSLMKLGWIGYMMHIEFFSGDEIVRTSPVNQATVKGDVWEYQMDWPEWL